MGLLILVAVEEAVVGQLDQEVQLVEDQVARELLLSAIQVLIN